MKTLTRLEDYLENAPMKTKLALTAAGTMIAAIAASSVIAPQPVHADGLHPSRTAPIVQQTNSDASSEIGALDRAVSPTRTAPIVTQTMSPYKSDAIDYELAIKRERPIPNVVVDDVGQLNKMYARTTDMLHDFNVIVARFHEARAWTGTSFTPEQKARNLADALELVENRAANPDVRKLDGYIVALRANAPQSQVINNIAADLNVKREALRDAALELNALIDALKDGRQDDVEKHRFMTETILKDAGYALNSGTDWSAEAGTNLAR